MTANHSWSRIGVVLLALGLMAASAFAQANDRLGLPGPIDFEGEAYGLAWSSQPSENYIKQEYLPAGDSPERYKQMILVETVSGGIAVMDAVRAQVDMLNKRKASDPLVNMDVIQNEATGEALLDFIISTKGNDGQYIVEWNSYRYARYSDATGNRGVMLFGVSRRAYGDDASKALLTQLKVLRPGRIKALTQVVLPRPAP
ncbi:hypothetical protein [Shinella sp.]|uniref:hypothetical protein n=1 Tax=Shinella sp. TaxID=1870904 RepID=UPI00289CD604|nr:hypothetical protein [Shinella sp.]